MNHRSQAYPCSASQFGFAHEISSTRDQNLMAQRRLNESTLKFVCIVRVSDSRSWTFHLQALWILRETPNRRLVAIANQATGSEYGIPKAVSLCSRGIVAICSKWSAETVVPTSAKLRMGSATVRVSSCCRLGGSPQCIESFCLRTGVRVCIWGSGFGSLPQSFNEWCNLSPAS